MNSVREFVAVAARFATLILYLSHRRNPDLFGQVSVSFETQMPSVVSSGAGNDAAQISMNRVRMA